MLIDDGDNLSKTDVIEFDKNFPTETEQLLPEDEVTDLADLMAFDRGSKMYVNSELAVLESAFEHINRKELCQADSDDGRKANI